MREASLAREKRMFRKLSAEAFGTFWLVFGGCGSALIAAGFPEVGIGFVGVSFAFGLTVLTMAYAVGIFPAATLIRRYRWVCLSAAVLKAKNCCLIFLRK